MTYIPPDNFRGQTSYNVKSFSVPGLMPTETPLWDGQIFSSPDGSILMPLFSIGEDEDNPFPFPVAISSLDKKVLLYDTEGDHIFQSLDNSGRVCFSFIVDGIEEALPVGQCYVDILVSGINKRFLVKVPDSPFALGNNSGYRQKENDTPLRFVVRGSSDIPVESTDLFVPYDIKFVAAPLSVVAKAYTTSGNTPVGVTMTSFTREGMYLTFSETTEPVTLEYIAWSLNTPLIISGIGRTLDVFRTDNNIVLG